MLAVHKRCDMIVEAVHIKNTVLAAFQWNV